MEMGFVVMFEHGIALECKQMNLNFFEDRQILGGEIGFWVSGIWVLEFLDWRIFGMRSWMMEIEGWRSSCRKYLT